MKCGDNGHRNMAGKPCGQNVPSGQEACYHHSDDPAQQEKAYAAQLLGAAMSAAGGTLSAGYPLPKLNSLESYEEAAKVVFRLSLKGDVKPWRIREARGALGLLLQAETIRAQRELNEALVASERGSPALIALNQYLLQTPSGQRRALTGVRITARSEESAS